MKIKELIQIQKEFDDAHGWKTKHNTLEDKVDAISNDTIGIFGEIGEFSNILKKLHLELSSKSGINSDQENNLLAHMKEELVDVFIYYIRLAAHLDLDIEEEYLKKLNINKKRFKKYEI